MKEQSNTFPIVISDIKEAQKPILQVLNKSIVCADCKKWIIKQIYANCVICEDAYHQNCMRPKQKVISKDWTCSHCIELKNTFPDTNDVEIDSICNKCKKEVDSKDEEICSKCNNIFHKKCYGSKSISPICNFCHSQKPPKVVFNIKLNQLLNMSVPIISTNQFILYKVKKKYILTYEILKIYQIQKSQNTFTQFFNLQYQVEESLFNLQKYIHVQHINFLEKCNAIISYKLKKILIKLSQIFLNVKLSYTIPCCVYDDKLRQNCFQSLQYALYCQNINFNDDLVYKSVKKNLNNGHNEKLDSLIGKDLNTFKKYKQVTKYGFYGPLMVEYNLDQGFYVKSVQPIAYKTLICEYAGDVFRLADQVYSTSDSMMTLLESGFAATSLVIIPEKNGNLAKYLSGINNGKKNSKKLQQNVKSRRYNVEGECRVILYACRDIKSGEILYYDYNEGGFKYNTNYFV